MPENEAAVPKLKLSEAMRLGAMLKPQGFGIFRNQGITACALDAVALALGNIGWGQMRVMFPWADGDSAKCPQCGLTSNTVMELTIHLNDTHRWTRERIADWIEAEFEGEKDRPEAEPVAADTPASELVGV